MTKFKRGNKEAKKPKKVPATVQQPVPLSPTMGALQTPAARKRK